MPLAGYLNREGISYASLKQEPPSFRDERMSEHINKIAPTFREEVN